METGVSLIAETFEYKVSHEYRICADVYRPAKSEGSAPVILWIHGGSFISGCRKKFSTTRENHLRGFLSDGYTVVAIDYRLAPETTLPGICQDVIDAYNWITSQGPELFQVDPGNIAVVGYSAGGFLALHCGYRAITKPRAIVSVSGYGDVLGGWSSEPFFYENDYAEPTFAEIEKFIRTTAVTSSKGCAAERARIREFLRRTGTWAEGVCGVDPTKDPERFKSISPLYNIAPDYPPTLLVHGEADTNVPFQQSVKLAKELKRYSISYKLISIPHGVHGFETKMAADPNVKESFKEILNFLKKYLQTDGKISSSKKFTHPGKY